jgi:hypothetical protein
VDAGGATERALSSGARPATPAPPPDDSGGLLGKALQSAEDLAGGVANLGARVVTSVEDALDDGVSVRTQAAPPSYANNPNVPAGLQGDGAASAGDSFFVTGAQKATLTAKVKDIYAAADAINKIGTELEQKGTSKYWFDDKQMLQSAKNLHGTASAMMKLATALDRGDVNKASIEKGNKALEYVDKVIKAADAVGAIRNLSLATEKMEEKTNQASVEAWADSVGEAFDKAGALIDYIPKGAIPGFVADYYKGLFSAPKNYISAFKTLMKIHYGAIDKEAGISGSSRRATDLGRTGLDWEGDLTSMFVGSYTQPRSKGGEELNRYMLKHRKRDRVDLFDVTLPVGKAVLTAYIESDLADDDPAKQAWITYVANSG